MSNATRWVGIDLHRRRSQIAILDEHGEITQQADRDRPARRSLTLLGEPDEHACRAGGDLRLGAGLG